MKWFGKLLVEIFIAGIVIGVAVYLIIKFVLEGD